VVLHRAHADEQPVADLRVRQAVAGRRAIGSFGVSAWRVATVRLWAISPVASSSCLARSANASMPPAGRGPCAAAPARPCGGAGDAATRRRAYVRGQLHPDAGPARPVDRLAVARLAASPSLSRARTRASIPNADSERASRVRSDSHWSAALTSASSPVLNAASTSSGTTYGPYPKSSHSKAHQAALPAASWRPRPL
jgi:hypothetical protein